MIYSCGEIIADMLENNDDSFQFCIGGAPLNLAYTISSLGGEVKCIGNVGNDVLGHKIVDFIKESKMDTKYIYIDNKRNTSMSFVTHKADGERFFTFARKNGADYNIPNEFLKSLNESNIIHIGSLLLSTKEGLKFVNKLIKKAKRLNIKISLDINYRSDLFSTTEEAKSIYNKIISKCDILKFSKDEVQLFSGVDDVYQGIKLITKPNQKVFITLGKEGSFLLSNNNVYKEPSISVKPIDTTGAGDAFYGCVLYYIDYIGFDKFFEKEAIIRSAIQKANICGAYATTKKGALGCILNRYDLDKIYGDYYKKTNTIEDDF